MVNLDWESLVPFIGEARQQLARADIALQHASSTQIKELKREEAIASQCTLEALEFGIRYAKNHPINMAMLRKIHAIVKRDGPNPKEIGRFRKRQNWIGPEGRTIDEAYFYPPEAPKIKGLLQELAQYMRRKEKDPLVQLAIFFAQFLIIHPFMDGNGRVARIYIPLFIWKKGLMKQPLLFMSGYFEKNRLSYFRKLFNISEKNAWEAWVQYFLIGVAEQSKLLTHRFAAGATFLHSAR